MIVNASEKILNITTQENKLLKSDNVYNIVNCEDNRFFGIFDFTISQIRNYKSRFYKLDSALL